jgi:hypothetical protein
MKAKRFIEFRHEIGRESPDEAADALDSDRANLLGLSLAVGA